MMQPGMFGKPPMGGMPFGKGKAPAAPAAPAAAAPATGCQPVYGPVANVCHSSIPIVGQIPVTTVQPIPGRVPPEVEIGPATAAPVGGVGMAPYGKAPFGPGAGFPPFPAWPSGKFGGYMQAVPAAGGFINPFGV